MFCPNCGAEYREGFTQCVDCRVDLVSEPPLKMANDRPIQMVEVFSTYNQGDIAFIKSLMEGEGIHYFFSGESTLMMIAAGAYARLLVASDQAPRAREVLKEAGLLQQDAP